MQISGGRDPRGVKGEIIKLIGGNEGVKQFTTIGKKLTQKTNKKGKKEKKRRNLL